MIPIWLIVVLITLLLSGGIFYLFIKKEKSLFKIIGTIILSLGIISGGVIISEQPTDGGIIEPYAPNLVSKTNWVNIYGSQDEMPEQMKKAIESFKKRGMNDSKIEQVMWNSIKIPKGETYWEINTTNYYIKVDSQATCNWYVEKKDRDCYLDIVVIKKSLGERIIIEEDFDMSFSENTKSKDYEYFFGGQDVKTIISTNLSLLKLSPGTHKFKYKFKHPMNEPTEKFNVSIFGFTIDPEVSSCGTIIQSSGTYEITTDLSSGNDYCIEVNASSVTIDGGGHIITGYGIDGGGDIGIHAVSGGGGWTGLQDGELLIKNINFHNISVGVYLGTGGTLYNFNATVHNCNFLNFDWGAIVMTSHGKQAIYNNTFYGNLTGNPYPYWWALSHSFTYTAGGETVDIYDNKIYNSDVCIWCQDCGNTLHIYNNWFETINNVCYIDEFYSADNPKFYNNTIINLPKIGEIYTDYPYTQSVMFYNNFFNTTGGGYLFEEAGEEYETNFYLNTTKQLGNPIYSNGAYIGGNFWYNESGGFSSTCTDGNSDCICDDTYTPPSSGISSGEHTDYLPLAGSCFTGLPEPDINVTYGPEVSEIRYYVNWGTGTTAYDVEPYGQTDSIGIFKVINNGTTTGNLQVKWNDTYTNVFTECGCNYFSSSLINLTTSYQTLCTLNQDATTYVWCRRDYLAIPEKKNVGILFNIIES